VQKGADVSLQNQWNNAAIHDTGLQDRAEIARMLIKAGADVNQKGQNGQTPLYIACNSQNVNAALVYVESGADVNALDNDNRPPILAASWNGNPALMKLLVSHGADVNFTDDYGNCIAKNLARNGANEALDIVLAKNANVNVVDESGALPIHYAVRFRHPKTAAMLVAGTKDLNKKESNSGNTPLHLAAINGDVMSFKELLKGGANSEALNNDQKKPLDYAVKYGHMDLVDFMAEAKLATKTDVKLTAENRLLLNEPVGTGEARVVYAGHSGWIVQTKNKVLVFDYWANNEAAQPGMVNGTFSPEEVADKDVYVFASHDHGDHYDPAIHEWAKNVKNIHYIYGFDPNKSWVSEKEGYHGPEFTLLEDHATQKINDVKISAIKSTDTGQGFLVEADGVSIWHPGDHAWFAAEDEELFKNEMKFIAGINDHVDIAFLPVVGCPSRWTKENIIEGFFYSIDQLHPKTVYPMHAFQNEHMLKEFAQLAEERKSPANIVCVENKGDHNLYSRNAVASK
jgi:ankyrin repeat protein